MNQAHLSVVMFSAMLSHGGGRETWLSNILPRLQALRTFANIDVYYVGDEDTDKHEKMSICTNAHINFVEIRLPESNGKLTSILRIIIFCVETFLHIRKKSNKNHFVVAVGTFYEGAVLALLRNLTRNTPRLVTWIRGVWTKEINHRHSRFVKQIITWLEKKFMQCSDQIIANGQDTKQFYETLLARHVEAIPNALDLSKYSDFSRAAFSNTSKTVAYIGRLSEEKGFLSFLNAVDIYFSTYNVSNLHFEIVGDGPLRLNAKAFVEERKDSRIKYIGPLSNEQIPLYLSTIDAGVNLTYSKDSGGGGVSNAMLELIGSKRLVIAWDSPIYKQVLNEDQALYVNESDTIELAKIFNRLNNDCEDMCRRIENSTKVLNRYTIENHVQHFINYLFN